jgi:hypothetical protein
MKVEGDPTQLAVKLELNSCYGKMIQQVGWKEDDEGNAVLPPYFCLFWAGRTTATTRAAMYKLVIDNEGWEDLISFETDACFSSRRWEHVPVSTALGDYEETELHNLAYVQNGIYSCDEVAHGRGMTRSAWPTLERDGITPGDMVRRVIHDGYVPYMYTRTTFVGLAAGLAHPEKWRRWVEEEREVKAPEWDLGSATKRSHDGDHCECQGLYERQLGLWHRTYTNPCLYMGDPKPYDLQWEGPVVEQLDESQVLE